MKHEYIWNEKKTHSDKSFIRLRFSFFSLFLHSHIEYFIRFKITCGSHSIVIIIIITNVKKKNRHLYQRRCRLFMCENSHTEFHERPTAIKIIFELQH